MVNISGVACGIGVAYELFTVHDGVWPMSFCDSFMTVKGCGLQRGVACECD